MFATAISAANTVARSITSGLSPNLPKMDWSHLRNAIIVCGHAVYNGGPYLNPDAARHDNQWSLQPFQSGEPPFFIEHVHRGVLLASQDQKSLLIFSGGQTRAPNILSEAQGYHHIAQLHAFWKHDQVRNRVTTEEFARDSFDNVLFGIARFMEAVGRLPDHVTIISWAFKEQRFRHHAWCLRWPISRFCFEASGTPHDLPNAQEAEAKTLAYFQEDPTGYGRENMALGKKKLERNPSRRQNGYSISCPILGKVLVWRGYPRVDAADVPWSDAE